MTGNCEGIVTENVEPAGVSPPLLMLIIYRKEEKKKRDGLVGPISVMELLDIHPNGYYLEKESFRIMKYLSKREP